MPDTKDILLHEIISNQFTDMFTEASLSEKRESSDPEPKKINDVYSQWALGSNGTFTPVGTTALRLPPGIYEPFAMPGNWGLERLDISSDGIYRLPDMATDQVLDEAAKFWECESRYRKHHLLYKRGIILYGPPGGGKTVTVKLLMNELVKRDGIVVVVRQVDLAIMILKALRRIEPERRLIMVMEDIDEIINRNGEASVLSLLDGENNIDNVLNLATTNYPDLLGPRIMNRPSRFDRRIEVGMPKLDARKMYLSQATTGELDELTLTRWATDTDTLSIAHLRELVAAVYCLDQPYSEVLERLKEMGKIAETDSGYNKKRAGFGSNRPTTNSPDW